MSKSPILKTTLKEENRNNVAAVGASIQLRSLSPEWIERELLSLECFEIPIDPRSYLEVQDMKKRYGKNLRLYFKSYQEQCGGGEAPPKSRGLSADFFSWLDGDAKPEVEGCSRQLLDSETVFYCATLQEADRYKVQVDPASGLLVWSSNGAPLTTITSAVSSLTSADTRTASDISFTTKVEAPSIHSTHVHKIDTIIETAETHVSPTPDITEGFSVKIPNNSQREGEEKTVQHPVSTTPLTHHKHTSHPALSTQSQSLPSSRPSPEAATGRGEAGSDTLLAQTQRDLPLSSSFDKLNKSKRKPSFSSLAVDPGMTMPVLARTTTPTTLATTSPFNMSGSQGPVEDGRRKDDGGLVVGSQGRAEGSLKSFNSFGSCGGESGSTGGPLQLRVSCSSTDDDNDDEEVVDSEDTDSASDSDSEDEGNEDKQSLTNACRDSSSSSMVVSLRSVPSASTSSSLVDGHSGACSWNPSALSCGSPEVLLSLQGANELNKESITPVSGQGGREDAVPPLLRTPSCHPSLQQPLAQSLQPSTTSSLPPVEKWIFVIKQDSFYTHPKVTKTFPRFHHSSFLGGTAVDAAGMFSVREGRIEELHLHSGHYRPTEIHLYRLLLLLLHKTSAEALATVQVDSQRVMHIARMVNAEGSKMKKTLTTDLWPALQMLDFLTCKKHMWGAGVFRQLHQRRGQDVDGESSAGCDVDSGPEIVRFSPDGEVLVELEGGTGTGQQTGDKASCSPLRGPVGRIRAASEPPVSPLTFGAYFGDHQVAYQTTAWEEADLI